MYILIHPAYMHVLTSSVDIFRGFQLLLSYEQMELKLGSIHSKASREEARSLPLGFLTKQPFCGQ